MGQHEGGEVYHGGLLLDMKVVKHLIAVPATNNLDSSCVYSGTEERHSTCVVGGKGLDVLGR